MNTKSILFYLGAMVGITLLLMKTCEGARLEVENKAQKDGISISLRDSIFLLQAQIDSLNNVPKGMIVIHDTVRTDKRIYVTKSDIEIRYIDTSKKALVDYSQNSDNTKRSDTTNKVATMVLPANLLFSDSFMSAKLVLRQDSQYIEKLTFNNRYQVTKDEIQVGRDSIQRSVVFSIDNPYITNIRNLQYIEKPRITEGGIRRQKRISFLKGVAWGAVLGGVLISAYR